MLKGMLALILVIGLGLTGVAFSLAIGILLLAGQGQLVGAVEGAAQLPIIGPLIALAVSVGLVWVVLACLVEAAHKTRNRRKRQPVYAQG